LPLSHSSFKVTVIDYQNYSIAKHLSKHDLVDNGFMVSRFRQELCKTHKINQSTSTKSRRDHFTIKPRYACCEIFVKGKTSADRLYFFMESAPLTKVSQQAHGRLAGKNGRVGSSFNEK
jgi:hypothetical protein